MRFPLSLRFTIPATILALGLTAVVSMHLVQIRHETADLMRNAELSIRNLANITAGALEAGYRAGDNDQARAAIERLAGHRHIQKALVVDPTGRIEHSMQIHWQSRIIGDPALGLPEALTAPLSMATSPIILNGKDRPIMHGAFPVRMRGADEHFLPGQTGWLLLEYDVSADAATMRRELLRRNATLALLLVAASAIFYAFLRRIVLVRIARLQETTRAVAGGDFSAQPKISGRDEIGALAEDFRIMTRHLQQFDDRFKALSINDAQTGLLNRRGFEQQLDQLLPEARLGRGRWLLCHFDIKGISVINSTLGHAAGDDLLRKVARHLRRNVARQGIAARIGSDEFSLLVPTEGQDAWAQARQVLKRLEELRFNWEDTSQAVRYNLGAALVDEHSSGCEEVIGLANAARLATKESGHEPLRIGYRDDPDLDLGRGPMRWVQMISDALEHDQFELVGQEIRPAGSTGGDRLFFEVLIRMRGPGGERIAPGEFLPAAEKYRLADRIDLWVLKKLFETLADPNRSLHSDFMCSINLSGLSLGSEEIIERVSAEIESGRILAEQLCFEITETAAITNIATASDFIERLRSLGCRFALDDFGSGVSSFGYLKGLGVDFIKIDGMFVRGIANDPIDRAIVKSINEIGQRTGKHTIAEFVEDAHTAGILERMGIDYLQGYWIGRPIALSKMLNRASVRRRAGGGLTSLL